MVEETDDGQTWSEESKAAVANRQFIAANLGKTPEEIKYLYPLYGTHIRLMS